MKRFTLVALLVFAGQACAAATPAEPEPAPLQPEEAWGSPRPVEGRRANGAAAAGGPAVAAASSTRPAVQNAVLRTAAPTSTPAAMTVPPSPGEGEDDGLTAIERAELGPPPGEPVDPKLEARAQRLIARGRLLYTRGDYDRAEEVVKEAITLYPFIAEANLVLGKIFLIRGSASRDRSLIASARLMFEMAKALDPSLREPAMLLELFLAQPPE